MREHNNVIQTQRDQIIFLNSEIEKVQRERMDIINAHASEIKACKAWFLLHACRFDVVHMSALLDLSGSLCFVTSI